MGDTKDIDGPPLIRYTGTFDFSKIYKVISGWYKSNGFSFHEKKYVHKGKNMEFSWTGDKKITEYYKYVVNVSFFIWDFKDVEVFKDEQKIKMNQGRLQIAITGSYVLDYAKGSFDTETQWERTDFMQKLREFYHKFILSEDIDSNIAGHLAKMVTGFYDKIKQEIGMEGA